MKVKISLVIFVLISFQSLGQKEVDSFLDLKSESIPANWPELIQQRDRWVLYKIVLVRGKRVIRIIPSKPSDLKLKYDSSHLILFSKEPSDSPTVEEIKYFAEQNTYSIKVKLDQGNGKTLSWYNGEKVVSLKNNFLCLEGIDLFNYDYRTGEIISRREYSERFPRDPSYRSLFRGIKINVHIRKPPRIIRVYSAQ